MEMSVPGFIHNFCTPNAILTWRSTWSTTLQKKSEKRMAGHLPQTGGIKDDSLAAKIKNRIAQIKNGKETYTFKSIPP
jgi:hypothetical protein